MDNSIKYIPLTELIPGKFHPNLESRNINLNNLTNSIKNYGILVPLIVRPKDNKYEIILGNRRYKAALSLGLDKVPVIIFNVPDDKVLELIILDNIQRKDLTSKEEAELYQKALEYPNTNSEKLSINLGIPLERITSKLNLLKKEKTPKNILSKTEFLNSNNYDNENNSINNDIINLSELNKEEKEREDLIMNNNEFMNNNININTEPVTNQGVQESQTPTFGGRFFPSLEDEPTNMNFSSEFNNITPPTSSSLIDLTDLSTETPQPQEIPTPQINVDLGQPMNNNFNQQPIMPELTQNPINQPEFASSIPTPNMEILQQQIQDINVPSTPIPTPEITPTMEQQPIMPNFNVEQPMSDFSNNITTEPINQEIPTPSFNIGQMTGEMQTQNLEPTTIIETPGFNVEPLPVNPTLESPIQQPVMDPITSINLDYNQMATPIDYSNTTPQKDVLPVVNMIKNLAINIESLGYKINITESDDLNSYKINIEVEK